ncbi:MAG: ATP synthase F1 subunit epsilon [Acidobacteriota bacterium]
MAKSDTFHCSVVTPERAVLEATASFVALPAFDGELGVLAHRAPLLAKLGAGKLRVEGPEGKREFFIAGGFAQIVGDKLTVLTEECRQLADLDHAAAKRDLQAALALSARGEVGGALRERALVRARAQLRLAS